MSNIIQTLNAMSITPIENKDFEDWLESKDVISFLKENLDQEEFLVYYNNDERTYFYGVLVPACLVNPPDFDDLMAGPTCTSSSSWKMDTDFSEPTTAVILPPLLGRTGSRTINQGEQLIYHRKFEGRIGQKRYFEILQKFTHIFNLHYLPERNAYCGLNQNGDIEDLVRIETPDKGDIKNGSAILFNRGLLDEYMALTDSAMVRIFDITRFRPSGFSVFRNAPLRFTNEDLFYSQAIETGNGSYMRGCQIIRPRISKEAIARSLNFPEAEGVKYESFLVHDWKNGEVKEVSCDPSQTATYSSRSKLPFEISPAFFRPDVLLKYKSDSEKYRIEGNTISCRAGWELKSFDINQAGQVHVYLAHLRELPHQEQIYWKSFNEAPKGSFSKDPMTPPKGAISESSFIKDFEGNWPVLDDPLENLKNLIEQLNQRQVPWWKMANQSFTHRVRYPVTNSADEWLKEIHNLDKLLIESFVGKWFKEKAQSLGRKLDPTLGSLKLIEQCLIGLKYEERDAQQIVAPLQKVHSLRCLEGHLSSEKELNSHQKQAIKEYGNYQNHFRDLCQQCHHSIAEILENFSV